MNAIKVQQMRVGIMQMQVGGSAVGNGAAVGKGAASGAASSHLKWRYSMERVVTRGFWG